MTYYLNPPNRITPPLRATANITSGEAAMKLVLALGAAAVIGVVLTVGFGKLNERTRSRRK